MNRTTPGQSSAQPDQLNARLGVLTRQEVEADILKPLIEALGAESGDQRVLNLVLFIIVQIAREQGRQLRQQGGWPNTCRLCGYAGPRATG